MCISSSSSMEKQAHWRKREQPLPALCLETCHRKASRKNLAGRWLSRPDQELTAYSSRRNCSDPLGEELAPCPARVCASSPKKALWHGSAQKTNPNNDTPVYMGHHSLQTILSPLIHRTTLRPLPFEKGMWHFTDGEANLGFRITASEQTGQNSRLD